MWVQITNIYDYEIEENHNGIITKIKRRKFHGTLNDEPYYIQYIHYKDMKKFEDHNIASTFRPYVDTINIDDFCLISQKSLDYMKSEFVVRCPNSQFENDGGWRFYIGNDEEYELLSNSYTSNFNEFKKIEKNSGMVIIIFREDIKTIPLLQNVVEDVEVIFKFSEEEGRFIKLQSFV